LTEVRKLEGPKCLVEVLVAEGVGSWLPRTRSQDMIGHDLILSIQPCEDAGWNFECSGLGFVDVDDVGCRLREAVTRKNRK
jgi:hypothetical protein